MKVLNIMLSRKLGGIEQSFADYSLALKSQKINVTNITSVFAKINPRCFPRIALLNLGAWDFLSILFLAILIIFIKPSVIIAHGNRAMNFARKATRRGLIVGVAHNYNIANLPKCDYIIALTEHMRQYLLEHDFEESRIVVIPNMINIRKDLATRRYHAPVVVGTIARFVKKKGVDVLLRSLARLRDQHYHFKAIIGGDGEEAGALHKLSKELNLEQHVSFVRWVNNHDKFFNDIDIFCVPSLHEPFGIAVLEAMANTIPIVSTDTEGPSEILRNRYDGLLCSAGSVDDLATKLAYLLMNSNDARKYAESAYRRVTDRYSASVIAPKLSEFIETIAKS